MRGMSQLHRNIAVAYTSVSTVEQVDMFLAAAVVIIRHASSSFHD